MKELECMFCNVIDKVSNRKYRKMEKKYIKMGLVSFLDNCYSCKDCDKELDEMIDTL